MSAKKLAKSILKYFNEPAIKKVEPKRYIVVSKRIAAGTAKDVARDLKTLLTLIANGDSIDKSIKKRRGRKKATE